MASNKTKEVVKSLNLKINDINLLIDNIIRIQIDGFRNNPSRMLWNFYPEKEDNHIEPIPVYMPVRVIGMRDTNPVQNRVKYQNPGLSIREWLAHFQYIFSFPEENALLFAREVDMSSLIETVRGFEIESLRFMDPCSLEFAQTVLTQFPFIKRFFACSRSFEDPSMYRNILIQNLDVLFLGYDTPFLRMELDDLLMINSKVIYIRSTAITDKGINRFLKHWMKESNSRMELVTFLFFDDPVLDKDVILKGTNYHEVLLDEARHSKQLTYGPIVVKDGYDIRRRDGTVGTVVIRQQFVRFLVWC